MKSTPPNQAMDHRTQKAFWLFAMLLSLPLMVSGQDLGEDLCPGDPLPPNLPADLIDRDGSEVVIDASRADVSRDDISVFSGEVVLTRADQTLKTQSLTVRHQQDQVTAEGGIEYSDRQLVLSAATADMDMGNDSTDLDQVEYGLRRGFGRGDAGKATLTGDSGSWLSDVTFTTCPRGNSDWVISARELTLDHQRGEGKAKGMKLRFKSVPLLYLPWASFPLDDRRRSGFLFPNIGSSDDDGLDLAIPYYWNIAPNMDATLTPRYISDRGEMLATEFRYQGARSRGEFDIQYLPDDDRLDTHRSYATWRHSNRFAPNWVADIDLRHVSDEQFFEDFGNSLQATSISFLRSSAEVRAEGDWWSAAVLMDAYETVDREIQPQQEPYNRLPRLYFDGTRPLGDSNLQLRLGAEVSAFDRDTGFQGNRLDLYPQLSWPMYRPAGYLLPSLGVRYTGYDLDQAIDDSPSRTTAIASLEGGLVFERSLSNGGIQTLEPRIYYLYVPFERQDDLPTFDTSELTFSFNQLFRSNRFTGADRQAEANQLSLAVTTRMLDGGRQLFDASLGTIVYFQDQRVQLPGRPEQDADTSAVVGEFNWRPSDYWRFALGFQYDPEDDEADQGLMDLQYRGDQGQIFNLGYRRRIGRVEQVDLSFLWPVNDRWSLVGRYNYSLLDDTTLETLAGFEYDSCCWALRLMGRRYVRNQDGDKRTALYLEVELKGLGSLGRSTGQVLERAILGYRAKDYRYQY
jgi:LPS-assembly protein